jgi:hypothetical protein
VEEARHRNGASEAWRVGFLFSAVTALRAVTIDSWNSKKGSLHRAAFSFFNLLLDVARPLFAVSLSRERFFLALFLAWFQIKRMPFNLFYNVFLLNLTLEASQSALQGFPILEMNFRQMNSPPSACPGKLPCRGRNF